MKSSIKSSALMLLSMTLLINASLSYAHEEGARVAVELGQQDAVSAGLASFQFELVDLKEKSVLGEKDLVIEHERILHAFIFDTSLREFRHVHPEFVKGKWQVSVTLPANGSYWFWVQGKLAVDGEVFAAGAEFAVTAGGPANPLPPVLGDIRQGVDGISRVTLSGGRIRAKAMVMLIVDFTRTDGTAPAMAPYLGALAHVVAVPSDGDSLVHVHPMATSSPTQLMLHTSFPEAGDYRLWVQFLDGGTLKVVPLSVTVTD